MHNRRDQRHMLNLSQMAMDHIDLQGLEEVGLFVDVQSPIDPGSMAQQLEQFQLERVGGLP